LWAKKRFALIIIYTMHHETVFMEKFGNFRANQAGRAGDQT
jgi:hypothetical protein